MPCPCPFENRRKYARVRRSAQLAFSVFFFILAWCRFGKDAAGQSAIPGVSLSATNLSFSSYTVGTTSGPKNFSLTNLGSAVLSIAGITLTGANASDFAQTNTCGKSLAVGTQCTISVTFTPTAKGSRTAAVTLTVTTYNTSSQLTVSLTGTGLATVVSLSATSLSFASQAAGTTSPAQTITLTNTGNSTLSITSIALTGINASDFTQTTTCGSAVSTSGTCVIVLLFTPSAAGTRAASLTIADNASGSPQSVSLSGKGAHDVFLSWTPSTTSGILGYNLYRGTASGGESATPLNSALITTTTYVDANVQAGQKYYYWVTTVGSDGITQSLPSNETSGTVPSP